MRRTSTLIALFVATVVLLLGCGSGAGRPRESAAPAASVAQPETQAAAGDSKRLRAELADAMAQLRAARSQLRTTLEEDRELQARLDALTEAAPPSHPIAAASPAGSHVQVFTKLSTSPNP